MKNKFKFLLAAGVAILGVAACEKALPDDNIPQRFPNPESTSYVKFIHAFSGRTPALTTGAGPNLFLYLSDSINRINGNFLGFTQSAGQYPAPSTAATNARSWYCAMPVGNYNLISVLARVTGGVPTPNAGDTILRTNISLAAGKFYTFFLADNAPTAAATTTTPVFTTVEDNWGSIAENKYKIRLANFFAWSDDVQELYSVREGRVIQGNISFRNAGDFIELNAPNRTDTFYVRKVSGSSPAAVGANLYTVSLTPVAKRAYTIYTRGRLLSGTSTVFQNSSPAITTNF
jgi:hypothetical protein